MEHFDVVVLGAGSAGESIATTLAGLVARLGAAEHRLARHARDVRALAADAQLLDEGDRAALLGQRGGDALAG